MNSNTILEANKLAEPGIKTAKELEKATNAHEELLKYWAYGGEAIKITGHHKTTLGYHVRNGKVRAIGHARQRLYFRKDLEMIKKVKK
ncbi:MAG: hypothetical protein ACTSQE_07475 [Candidatus Heimdallarchaeaceae archaeon]